MEIKMCTCPNGHYFNADIYDRCPECGAEAANRSQAPGGYGGGAFPKTTDPSQSREAAGGYGGGAFPKTTDPSQSREVAGYGGGAFPKTTAPGSAASVHQAGPATPFSVPTQAAVDMRDGTGSEPVVGWLVCIEGPMRGVDFRLHDGYNFIGREEGEQAGVRWLPSDFKKRGGYQRSIELAREYGLYRQNYCGCLFSRREET